MDKHLAVFVHGWGAGQEKWWGETRTALENFPEFRYVRFHFHRYAGKHGVMLHGWQRLTEIMMGTGAVTGLGELGQHLWTDIKHEMRSEHCQSLALFGHSFGGLVVADAICYAAMRSAQRSKEDEDVLKAVTAIALCCTPIGGAHLAQIYNRLAQPFGRNPHIENLLKNDDGRQEVVNAFFNYLNEKPHILTVFRASEDGIVTADEVYRPFRLSKLQIDEDVLIGTHSDCIRNIGPFGDNDRNFHKIASWVRKSMEARSLSGIQGLSHGLSTPKDLRNDFKALIDRLENELRGKLFREWGELRKTSKVSDDYLLRMVLQQLIYAATRIHLSALGSANLWVAHYANDSLHLRSAEREGYFESDQLVVHTGYFGAGADQVAFRCNQVKDEFGANRDNSAAAQAYLMGEPRLVAIHETQFDSRSDQRTGITHVLAIPLYSKSDLRDVLINELEGAPLAITIDFDFPEQPRQEDVEALLDAARDVTDTFHALNRVWPDEGIRLDLH